MEHSSTSTPQTVASKQGIKSNIQIIQSLITEKMSQLLKHPYFLACKNNSLDTNQLIGIIKNLYSFSIFFERILTRRISLYTNQMNDELLIIARQHLREEIGHVELFRECLLRNGVNAEEISLITPSRYGKAIFGYLLATIEYENEYVTNVALIQVMELVALHFFNTTLEVMIKNDLYADAFKIHGEDDSSHALLGLEHYNQMDARSLRDCQRIISDLFGLFDDMLTEWLEVRV